MARTARPPRRLGLAGILLAVASPVAADSLGIWHKVLPPWSGSQGNVCVGADAWIELNVEIDESDPVAVDYWDFIPAFAWEVIEARAETGFVDPEGIAEVADWLEEEASESWGFRYTAREIGRDTILVGVQMKESDDLPSLAGTVTIEIDVVPCYHGLWQENRRKIRIEQDRTALRAYVVEGSYSCYEGKSAEGELDFRATIRGDGTNLLAEEATGLLVCNPKKCVEKGKLPKTERRPFKARLSKDGKSLQVFWIEREFEDCKETGLKKNMEIWHRHLPFPQGPPGGWPGQID